MECGQQSRKLQISPQYLKWREPKVSDQFLDFPLWANYVKLYDRLLGYISIQDHR